MWVRRPWGMNLLYASPEGIQIKKGPWTGRTGQLNTLVGPSHMGADSHMRSGQSFTAPLNSAPINPLDAPHIQTKGCHVGRDGDLQSLRSGQGGSLLCLCTPSASGMRDSGSTLSGCWEGGFDTVVVGVSWHLLTMGGAIGMAEWDMAPHKSPYRPSASDLTTANSTFWRPTASRHWASSCRRLDWYNKCRPWKEKKGGRDLSQRSGLATKQLMNSQEVQALESKGNTWVNSPWASSSARAGIPPASVQVCTQSSCSNDSSVDETISNV